MRIARHSCLVNQASSTFGAPRCDPRGGGQRSIGQAKEACTGTCGLPKGQPIKIVLAEDNAVNRALAVHLLEKRGYAIVVAENGREALAAIERVNPEVVLMDVQMPEMDGLEAIQVIRRKEKGGQRHLPIIALTAHAMKGNREQCLEAGADEYVTKPIRAPELFATIERVMSGAPGLWEAVAPAPSGQTVLDVGGALERLEGDRDLLEEIVRVFRDEWPKLVAEIRAASGAGDLRLLERTAHTLKGSSSNVGARSLSQSAAELELLARSGDIDCAKEKIATLEQEAARLFPELEALLHKAPARNSLSTPLEKTL